MKAIVNVEAAILCDGNWLLVQRSMLEEHEPGAVSMVGGKVDSGPFTGDVLRETVRREVLEEVGIVLQGTPEYVVSSHFITDRGDPVVNIVFLCEESGPLTISGAPEEVTEVLLLSHDEIERDGRIRPWTRDYLRLADALASARRAR